MGGRRAPCFQPREGLQGDGPKGHLLLANSVFFRDCSSSQHKTSQGEDFSELLDDIKKTLCHFDIIMEGFYFTTPFIDLYLPFLDLQNDTLNRSVMVEQV